MSDAQSMGWWRLHGRWSGVVFEYAPIVTFGILAIVLGRANYPALPWRVALLGGIAIALHGLVLREREPRLLVAVTRLDATAPGAWHSVVHIAGAARLDDLADVQGWCRRLELDGLLESWYPPDGGAPLYRVQQGPPVVAAVAPVAVINQDVRRSQRSSSIGD